MIGMIAAAGLAATNAVTELDPVVVEASRLGKSPSEMPMAVEVVGADRISAGGARSLAAALERNSSAVNVMRTGAGNPALTQITMRGWGENGFGRVLVTADGERLGYADMSAPLLTQVNLGSVERVEILHGSQCVLHGDGASAGMVNIVTEAPDYGSRGRIEVRGGSFDTFGARASYSGGDRESGVKYWSAGGWERSDGFRDNNGWSLWNARGGIRKEWDNGSFLKVSAFWNDADYELPGYLSATDWKHHPRRSDSPHDWYRRTTWGMNVTGEGVINEDNKVRTDFSFSRSSMKSRSLSSGSYPGYDPVTWSPAEVFYTDDYRMFYDLYSYAFTPQWINTSDLFGLGNELIAGATYRFDRLHGSTHDRAVYTPDFWGSTKATRDGYEYNRETMAFFAQDTLSLTDYLSVQFGGRYQRTWSENTALAHPRRTSDTYAADAALLVTPVEDLKTYVKFSRYFRNPFLDEVPYRNYVAQEILSPETGWSADAGFDWKFLEEFSVFGNVFVSRTKHEIMYDKFLLGGAYGNNINSPSATVREGFTAGARWEREKTASAGVTYTYVDAEFDGGVYDGNKIPMSPESTVTASGRVWIWDECSVFGGMRFLSTRRAVSDFPNDGQRLASVCTFHCGAQYAPEWAPVKGLKFGVSVDNLFDRRFADTAVRSAGGGTVYYPASGRSVMFTVSYEF